MACGISSCLSGPCRERLRRQQQLAPCDDMPPEPESPASVQNLLARQRRLKQPTLQTVSVGDTQGGFFGQPKFPRPDCWHGRNSPEKSRAVPPEQSPSPLPQLPDIPLAPLHVDPLGSPSRPKRYGITHPGRYGEQDREGAWKRTMLEASMDTDRQLRQRLEELRFPKLHMLSSPPRHPRPPGGSHRSRSCRRGEGQRHGDRRNVTLPRTIRSNMVVDARGRQMFADLGPVSHDCGSQPCSVPA
eukprot:TRINITY_DN9480_c1_g1_i1.p1 TRINITY_DN9480_c1_g1~~TRINITY_DN9480_c1_g1_i1.p1  ORF type:complete len:244 (+),score=32.33 TRINITY_DN9480_c1_g1_i1:80-811(+)